MTTVLHRDYARRGSSHHASFESMDGTRSVFSSGKPPFSAIPLTLRGISFLVIDDYLVDEFRFPRMNYIIAILI